MLKLNNNYELNLNRFLIVSAMHLASTLTIWGLFHLQTSLFFIIIQFKNHPNLHHKQTEF